MRISTQFNAVIVLAVVVAVAAAVVTTSAPVWEVPKLARVQITSVLQELHDERLSAQAAELATRLDRDVRGLRLDAEALRDAWESGSLAEPPAPAYANSGIGGLPAFGMVDPMHGVYADLEFRGSGSPWLPRTVVRAAQADRALAARLSGDLRRALGLTPLLQRTVHRREATVDRAWIVLTSGVTNAAPAYDYGKRIKADPTLIDRDDTEEERVRLLAPAANPDRRTRWLKPYLDPLEGRWLSTVVAPLYAGNRFEGSVGLDVRLSPLRDLATPGDSVHGAWAFVITREGRLLSVDAAGLVALGMSAETQAALQRSAADPASTADEGLARGLEEASLEWSADPEVRALGEAMQVSVRGSRVVGLASLSGAPAQVAWSTVASSDWRTAMVLPMGAAMDDAAPALVAMQEGTERGQLRGAVLAALLLLVALLATRELRLRIALPLERLSQAVAVVSRGRLELPAMEGGPTELQLLETRFRELLTELAVDRARLVRRTAQMSTTLRSIREGLFVCDADHRISLMNPAAETMCGWTEAEALGRPLGEVLRLEVESTGARVKYPGRAAQAFERAAAELQVRSRQGAVVPIVESRAAVHDEAGAVLGSVVTLRDASEERRAREELLKLSKLQTLQQVAAGIAHDFNNLLATILGNVEMAQLAGATGGDSARHFRKAESALERAGGLTRQFLTFARGSEPERNVLWAGPVIQAAAELAHRGRGSRLEVEIGEPLCAIVADKVQLGQVVQNLVMNADQATGEGGTIHVTAASVRLESPTPGSLPAGGYLTITVSDTGVGIPADDLSRVFDAFFTTRAQGTGLGLAVVQSVVARHHGHVVVESEVGRGTTVRVWFPAADAPPLEAPRVRAATWGSTGRLLLMDDDSEVRDVLTRMIEALGYEVVATADGVEAVDAARVAFAAGEGFVVALLDLTVAEGKGGEWAATALGELFPELPLVACSGYSDRGAIENPKAYGFTTSLPKPCSRESLRAALARAMGEAG